jgi:hypothetical protein
LVERVFRYDSPLLIIHDSAHLKPWKQLRCLFLKSKRLVEGRHAGTVCDPMIVPTTCADALDLTRLTAGVTALMRILCRSHRRQVMICLPQLEKDLALLRKLLVHYERKTK